MGPQAGFPAVGDKLGGRFRVVFGRGSGPCGVVFKALDLALDLPVAVKVFKPEFFDCDFRDQNLMRLYRARVYQDPNLVKIYEVQEDRGLQFITCQLMEGMSLQAVLDLHAESGEHFTVPKIRALFTRMLVGLQAIHKTGAIHGNLKPQNMFVLPDRLVLSDPYYLVSRLLREGEEIPVSDYYRGPEQLTDPALELRESDIYSLALIVGEVVGGVPVKPAIPLSQQVPRLTQRFDELFVRATDPDPARRYNRLEEFGDALVEVLGRVESEGLWLRRYHETGSFKAIRIQRVEGAQPVPVTPRETVTAQPRAPEPVATRPVEPEVTAQMPAEAAPGPAPEPAIARPVVPEPASPGPAAPAVQPAPEPEVTRPAEPEPTVQVGASVTPAPASEAREEVLEPTLVTRMPQFEELRPSTPAPKASVVEEPSKVLSEDEFAEEGVVIATQPEQTYPEDEALEGIEVIAEEVAGPEVAEAHPAEPQEPITPPVPAEAYNEDDYPTLPGRQLPPEAVSDTIELESLAEAEPQQAARAPTVGFAEPAATPVPGQAPAGPAHVEPSPYHQWLSEQIRGSSAPHPAQAAPPVAPFERMRSGPSAAAPGREAAGAVKAAQPTQPSGFKSFLLLFALFVVVGGGGVLVYLKLTTDRAADTSGVVVPSSSKPAPIPGPEAKAKAAPASPAPAAPTAPAPGASVQAPAAVTVPSPAGSPPPPAAVAVQVPQPPAAPPTLASVAKCPHGMAKVITDAVTKDAPGADVSSVAFCIDAYEYPGKGEKPKTGVSSSTAARLCQSSGKRLCTADEWKTACGSARYPYGADFDPSRCNVSGPLQASGSFPSCRSEAGVYDLSGNAAEWASDGQLHGGDASSGRGATCGAASRRFMPGPTSGFRCCADATR